MKKLNVLFLMFAFLVGCSSSSNTKEERDPSKESRMDVAIRGSLNVDYFEYDVDLYHRLNITIESGRVLLTGNMKDDKMKADAIRIAKGTYGVKEVIDRLRIDHPRTLSQYLYDKWLKTEVGTKLVFTDQLESGKYEVEVMEDTVYILGTAINEVERQKVIDVARGISGVKKVVAYINLQTGMQPEQPKAVPQEQPHSVPQQEVQQPWPGEENKAQPVAA